MWTFPQKLFWSSKICWSVICLYPSMVTFAKSAHIYVPDLYDLLDSTIAPQIKPHCYMTGYMTWHLTSTEISQDLLRSQNIYWFGIINLTFDIWHAMTFDIYIPWYLTFDMTEVTDSTLMLMILAQFYHIFTDGFRGFLQSKKKHRLRYALRKNRGLLGNVSQFPKLL